LKIEINAVGRFPCDFMGSSNLAPAACGQQRKLRADRIAETQERVNQ
jgi:hypothetical protein